MSAKLIGIDWGSTHFRAYLISENAIIMDKKFSNCGMMSLLPHQFEAALKAQIDDWLVVHPTIPIICCGMVGARQGWKEASYLECPVNLDKLATQLTLVPFEHRQVYIVPGLNVSRGEESDVMRGEETQLYGALGGCPYEVFCLPGTHCKWVAVKQSSVDLFTTFMTGELFSVLEKQSILAKQMSDQEDNEDAFCRGVNRAKLFKGLLSDLIKIRALMLLNKLEPQYSRSYLSGLLIGYEIMGARTYWDLDSKVPISIIADSGLTKWYLKAFNCFGCCDEIKVIDSEQSVVNGLFKIVDVL